jgi:hypothetical protein
VDPLHHEREILSVFQVPDRVVVIVEQRCHPRDVSVLGGLVVEAIPEDFLRGLLRESRETITATRGDEVGLVVNEPVFEAVMTVVDLVLGAARLFDDVL